MSRRTFKIVDLYCNAANWQSCIDSNTETLAEHPAPHVWRDELTGEIDRWSENRDKSLAKLRALMDALDDREKTLLRTKSNITDRVRTLGIEPNWIENLM